MRTPENLQTSRVGKTVHNILILVYDFGLRSLSVICAVNCFEGVLTLRIDSPQITVSQLLVKFYWIV